MMKSVIKLLRDVFQKKQSNSNEKRGKEVIVWLAFGGVTLSLTYLTSFALFKWWKNWKYSNEIDDGNCSSHSNESSHVSTTLKPIFKQRPIFDTHKDLINYLKQQGHIHHDIVFHAMLKVDRKLYCHFSNSLNHNDDDDDDDDDNDHNEDNDDDNNMYTNSSNIDSSNIDSSNLSDGNHHHHHHHDHHHHHLKINPYQDAAMPILCNATISAPHIHAKCFESLVDVISEYKNKFDSCDDPSTFPALRILDVGSGSGYVCSVLAHMIHLIQKQDHHHHQHYYQHQHHHQHQHHLPIIDHIDSENEEMNEDANCELKKGNHLLRAEIYGIDHMDELVEWSKHNIQNDEKSKKFLYDEEQSSGNNIQIHLEVGDGFKGKSQCDYDYFDIIHVGAAAEKVPESLVMQLKVETGRMVIPIGSHDGFQHLTVIEKRRKKDGTVHVQQQAVAVVKFVPLTQKEQQLQKNTISDSSRGIKPKLHHDTDSGRTSVVIPFLYSEGNPQMNYSSIKWDTINDVIEREKQSNTKYS